MDGRGAGRDARFLNLGRGGKGGEEEEGGVSGVVSNYYS